MLNRLAAETSPYLRQHADNPVDWYPWGEEAFARARLEEKPIFLSIGYSTCHWCHVMAHESFENPAIAELLNRHFVSIKVDREDRPDVDRVYMSYVQALTGHGGWPLSAWLTPELKPFYGGTYFPPEDRYGRPGFPAVLNAIARGWKDDRASWVAQAETAIATLRGSAGPTVEGALRSEPAELATRLFESGAAAFEKAYQQLVQSFDPERGGFGGAPKFPRASNLAFLFRCAALQGPASEAGREATHLAAHTLRQMARGGIHDQVGGGFHRYSVDEDWFVPHFEKMLYDQAQIALNALEAWQATSDERHAWLVRDILDYVLRDLSHPEGGFYSAEDADSEPAPSAGSESSAEAPPQGAKAAPPPSKPVSQPASSEGAFYIWTQAEVVALLGPADAPLFCAHFGVKPEGNVPESRDPHREFTGRNILAQTRPLAETAKSFGLGLTEASDRLASSLERLRVARARRPRPGLDDKIITAWNGLMISALARASAVPAESLADRRSICRTAAVQAAEFVRRELFDPGRGVLFRSWRGGRGASDGFAEDYAFFVQGLLDLYEATWDVRWLQWAEALQAKMDELFWDEEGGGYFNSAAGAPDIVLRLKEDYDGAEAASSSVAAGNLLRLSLLLGDLPAKLPPAATSAEAPAAGAKAEPPLSQPIALSRRHRALRTLEAFRPRWQEVPQALPQMLCSLGRALEPPRHVVLAGHAGAADFQALAAVLFEGLGPQRALLAADGGPAQAWLAQRAPWLAEMRPLGGKAAAYVCEGFACQLPVAVPEDLRRFLAAK